MRRSFLLSPAKLREMLDLQSGALKVLDATWHFPQSNRNAANEFVEKRIPSARYFDIDVCSDRCRPDLPHMMPNEADFAEYLRSIGISPKDKVVVYDVNGIFSAPRVWFMLESVGIDAAVLDGGLPAWERLHGAAIESGEPLPVDKLERYELKLRPTAFVPIEEVAELSTQLSRVEPGTEPKRHIIDARSHDRFDGKVDEPRPGLRRGHVPSSTNIPFSELLQEDGTFKTPEEIKAAFAAVGVVGETNEKIIFSCGSGVTACVDALAAAEFLQFPMEQISIYDGSFAEWGKPSQLPVEVTAKINER